MELTASNYYGLNKPRKCGKIYSSNTNEVTKMDIARLSMAMSQVQVKQDVSLGVMSKVMDQSEVQTDGLIEMLDQPVHPHLGQALDFRA